VELILDRETANNSFEDLLTDSDISTLKARYEEAIRNLLEEAKRRHVRKL
jgi:hypothetical protein